jgi:streptogramin lyase
VVTEGDGFIWAPAWTAEDGNLLLRVDPQTGEVATFPSEPLEFVIDIGEGGVWGVARRGQDLFEGRGGIVRFDPVTGGVDAGVGIDAGTIALAVAPGSVWVIHYEEGVTRVELRPL